MQRAPAIATKGGKGEVSSGNSGVDLLRPGINAAGQIDRSTDTLSGEEVGALHAAPTVMTDHDQRLVIPGQLPHFVDPRNQRGHWYVD